MVAVLDDTKKNSMAVKLGDMKLLQQLLLDNEEKFLLECTDGEIAGIIRRMLDDDRKNLALLNTVVDQFGLEKNAEPTVLQMVEKVRQLMASEELSFFDKVFQHELLKHQQVMNGMTIHKAAQKVGADIMVAIRPLSAINSENRTHQEQLKGILEILGVRELTGQDADQGIWSRVQDAIAAITGAVGGAPGHEREKATIQDAIRQDHNQLNMLFTDLMQSNDSQKIQECFAKINQLLTVHIAAEEEVVYPRVRGFYGEENTQQLYDQHALWIPWWEELRLISPSTPEFKNRLREIWDHVTNHIRQEENTMLVAIDNNMSSKETEQLAARFDSVKSQLEKRNTGAYYSLRQNV
ncbi:hemerythrin domain-containing protein [Cylindrospermopsis raciborskii]|uniref:DNA nickase n=2 Tax=Cylindrospermopsis raciborskii TaxID=77022 RepID=A0A853M845_9CYAN|nr:hemerythrin domain-containing protein [Cylindrospermopsis raciborskii]EFA69750.1 Hemerythrin HHE cation binding region protein [Cylindrospermopsis raciborskii CS-505]OBU75281.1 DNA nickase [Cylindrospermopsis raciborskii CS-505]PNJ91436.1 DNA nickase [Cylindrospermopsis raciborskii C07]PNJ91708.1 DNA nickase [Cylindrospermopsis raciborskii C03]PNJ96381.1 DNA nickase [Cylindrospermopsis raciborskii C04]